MARQESRMNRLKNFFFCLLPVIIASAGCVPLSMMSRPDVLQTDPAVTSPSVQPGQNLFVQLDDGSTVAAIAGQRYVSALGETCVEIDGYPTAKAACLRNGTWMSLQDIFWTSPEGVDARP
jgi:hypothetical protein